MQITDAGQGTNIESDFMTDVLNQIRTIATPSGVAYIKTADTMAWLTMDCPWCGARQLLVVAAEVDSNGQTHLSLTQWLRCTGCLKGSVLQAGDIYPSQRPLRVPIGLPPEDSVIWDEVRSCLGAGAHVAAVMLCRKLLFHIAVANGLDPKDETGWAPSFVQAVNHLERVGIFTSRMRPWVERIKEVGNDANHEITPVSKGLAMDVATFTQQLLVLAYELDALQANPSTAESSLGIE